LHLAELLLEIGPKPHGGFRSRGGSVTTPQASIASPCGARRLPKVTRLKQQRVRQKI
jgi:hypothetical protein